MKICNLCENISVELIEKIRDIAESLLEIRSQKIALKSIEAYDNRSICQQCKHLKEKKYSEKCYECKRFYGDLFEQKR